MHGLWQYTYKLLCSVHSIASGCPQEKEEERVNVERAILLRQPDAFELAKPILTDKLNFYDFYEWIQSSNGLQDICGCNSLDELEPDLRRFVEWLVP